MNEFNLIKKQLTKKPFGRKLYSIEFEDFLKEENYVELLNLFKN
jgi:hypothetical protein